MSLLASPAQASAPSSARAHAEALTSAILEDLATLTRTFWSIGEKLHAFVDDRLFAELGYASFSAYVEARLGVAVAQAYKMVRVIRNYVRADAERLGLERADSLIRYAKHIGVDPGELIRQDALIGSKPVSEASVREIETAANAAYKAKVEARNRAPAVRRVHRENRTIADELKRVLAAAGIRGAKLQVAKGELVIRLDRAHLAKRFLG